MTFTTRRLPISNGAKALWKDFHILMPVHNSSGTVVLYYMKADAEVDGELLELFKSGRVPQGLIGTVAEVSEIKRHILQMRSMARYRHDTIVIRIWHGIELSSVDLAPILELNKEAGPVSILAGSPIALRDTASQQPAPPSSVPCKAKVVTSNASALAVALSLLTGAQVAYSAGVVGAFTRIAPAPTMLVAMAGLASKLWFH